jgi:hypothetical protein
MSRRNRENRARKQTAKTAKRHKPSIPPIPAGFIGNGPDAVRARTRLAISMPFMLLAKDNPYTPGMELPYGSIVVGENTNTQGYVPGDLVAQIIRETQRALGVQVAEVIRMLLDLEASGAIRIVGSDDVLATSN